MKSKIILDSIVTATLLFLIGCGKSSPPPSQSSSKITVSGTAVDELILNGKVRVSKPDDTLLVEGRTDDTNGTYALDVINYIGPVVVNVTCDEDSRLLIGTTQEICPANLDLNSVANADGDVVTINISPLTEVTYQRAVELGSGQITEDSVTQASNQIAIIFGVDPIVDNPTIGTYSATIEAFHLVADADPNRDLFDVIDDFAEDTSDGVVDNSVALIDALEDANITNSLTISDTPYEIPNNPVLEPTNNKPTATAQSVTLDEDTTKAITLSGTDLDLDALTYTVTTSPTNGTFLNGVYTPNANYHGSDSFSFTANDGEIDSEPATVSITVEKQQINEADTVHGVVTNSNGEILEGAKVRLYNADNLSLYDEMITTDETGSYMFSNLPLGRYYLVVSGGNGFIDQTQVIIIN